MAGIAEPFGIDIDGLRLSSLCIEPETPPLATVLALPGGGYGSRYWHHPRHPAASLLTLGAALGYRVVALDRPGYGASASHDGFQLDRQAHTLVGVLAHLANLPESGAGLFLIGHSMGGIAALMTAAIKPEGLSGVDVSGVPYRFSEALNTATTLKLETGRHAAGDLSPTSLFYGPPGSYDPALSNQIDAAAAPLPIAELNDSLSWPQRFAQTSAAIDVPVQFTLGEHDRTSAAASDILAETGLCFKAAPRVVVHRQIGAGHNVSLHHVGRAYHLRAFAFFDEILALDAAAA